MPMSVEESVQLPRKAPSPTQAQTWACTLHSASVQLLPETGTKYNKIDAHSGNAFERTAHKIMAFFKSQLYTKTIAQRGIARISRGRKTSELAKIQDCAALAKRYSGIEHWSLYHIRRQHCRCMFQETMYGPAKHIFQTPQLPGKRQ